MLNQLLFLSASAVACYGLYAKSKATKKSIKEINEPQSNATTLNKPRVIIEYCVKCRWHLRAGWMAQELLSTFGGDLDCVELKPSELGGTYLVTVVATNENNETTETVIWNRKGNDVGFPEAKILKSRVRDAGMPTRKLGKCIEGKGKCAAKK